MAFSRMLPHIYCYLQVDKDKALLQKPLSLEFSSFTFSWILAFLKMGIRTTSNFSLMHARSCHLCGLHKGSKAGYTRSRSSSKKCILIISTRSQTMLLTALLFSVPEMNQLPIFGGRGLANYPIEVGLGQMICSSQGSISRCDVCRSINCVCVIRLAFLCFCHHHGELLENFCSLVEVRRGTRTEWTQARLMASSQAQPDLRLEAVTQPSLSANLQKHE